MRGPHAAGDAAVAVAGGAETQVCLPLPRRRLNLLS
jgi:hypothetical protein